MNKQTLLRKRALKNNLLFILFAALFLLSLVSFLVSRQRRITIPELSASFYLPVSLKDLKYEVSSSGGIRLTTAWLEKQGEYCAIGGTLGTLRRVYEKDLASSEGKKVSWWGSKEGLDDAVTRGDAVKLDDFYIYYYGPQDTCTADVAVTKRLYELVGDIPDLLRTARSVK